MCFLYVGAAPSLSECDSTRLASTSITIHPCQTCPATCTHGNPPGRSASLAHTVRRCVARAVAMRARDASSTSSRARHAVGADATVANIASDACSTSIAPATLAAPTAWRALEEVDEASL